MLRDITLGLVVTAGAVLTAAPSIPWGTPAHVRYIDDHAVTAALADGRTLLEEPGFRITIARRRASSPAGMSDTTNQILLIKEGGATLITGGTLEGAIIRDGQTRRVNAGDLLVIPARTPYWWKETTTSVAYLAVERETPPSGKTWGLPDVVQHITAERVHHRMSEPGGPADPILIDPGVVFYAQRKFKDDEAEIHPNHSHVFLLVDGTASFLTGEHGAAIEDGKPVGRSALHQVAAGGIMIVPSKTPHQWVSISGNSFGPKEAIGYIAVNMDDPR